MTFRVNYCSMLPGCSVVVEGLPVTSLQTALPTNLVKLNRLNISNWEGKSE